MKKWWEFEVGFYVEAETEQEAYEKAGSVLEAANKFDPEGDATIEHSATYGFDENGRMFLVTTPTVEGLENEPS